MNIIEKIIEAVWELQAMNCKDEDLIISFSPIIERLLIEEMNEMVSGVNISATSTIRGIKTYSLWPYNEIVVYDTKNTAYHPQLIKKIEVSVGVKNIPK